MTNAISALADKFSLTFKAQTDQADDDSQQSTVLTIRDASEDSSFHQEVPQREGNTPHFLYPALVEPPESQSSSMPANHQMVFLDSRSGPSWIKSRCVRRFSLNSFASRNPTRISGVGKSTHLVDTDVTLKIGLLDEDGSVCWAETTAGIVPDNYTFPCDILLGRSIHQRLEIRYLKAGLIKVRSNDDRAHKIHPVPDVRVHVIDETPTTIPEVKFWKTQFPSLFDPSATHDTPPVDYGVRHAIDVGHAAPVN